MNRKLTLSLLMIILLLQACKKKSVPGKEKEKPTPIRLLTRVWGTDHYNQSGTIERNTVYTYDEQNRLVKKVEDGTKVTNYTYKDGVLTEVEYLFGGASTLKTVSKYLYENGRVKGSTEIFYTSSDVIQNESATTFIYTDGKVTSIESVSNGKPNGIRTYTYAGENIATYKGTNNYLYTYKYDDKKNPYWNKELKAVLRSADNFYMNNAVEIMTEPGYNIKIIDKYIYTYDNEGYPLTMQTPDGKATVRTFEYIIK
jgi:hypothetical protein